ncbi:MAG: peptidase MA family metallohydrolase [Chloroflexi bacterium]|nr:peptidase MA family metallohydrolase [Chloroflexota bacterium]
MARAPGSALVLALALALALAAALPGAAPARAGEIAVDRLATRSEDPRELTFTARVRSAAGLASARLEYLVLNPDGNIGGSGEVEVSGGPEEDLIFTLQTIAPRRYIPVGSAFTYRWLLVDREGTEFVTEEQRFTFLDGRYSWTMRTEGLVTVYWYGASEAAAELALAATASSLADTEDLLEVTVPYPVKVIVWRSESEGELAQRPRSGVFDATVITGGQRVAPDLLFVFEPSRIVIRHEAAHVVTKVAGDGPFTTIPSWLDEGTAVYMQHEPGAGYTLALAGAIGGDRTLPLRGLASPPGDPGRVDVFYGQSWSVVSHLIDIYGRSALADLYRTVKAGSRIDDALLAVYGFDQDGLYNEWRAVHGLPPVAVSGRAATVAPAPSAATVTPLGLPTPRPAGGSAPVPASTAPAAAPAGGAATEAAGAPGPAPGTPASGVEAGTGAAAQPVVILLTVTTLLVLLLGGGAVALMRRPERPRPGDS